VATSRCLIYAYPNPIPNLIPNPRNQAGSGSAELLIYASAALGVVHDLATNTQRYFEGHSDDITCLSVSRDRLGLG
jgi:hypothetical protein